MISATHNNIVNDICRRHSASTRGWYKSMARALYDANADCPAWQSNFPPDFIRGCFRDVCGHILPDAYRVSLQDKELCFWEVEVTHHVKNDKANKLARVAIETAEWGWAFRLFLADRYGRENEVYVVDGINRQARILSMADYKELMAERMKKCKSSE